MYTIVYKQSVTDIVVITIAIVIIVFVLYSISRYFLQSAIILYLLLSLCLAVVVRAIGIFIMYPGTYRFMTAQIQKYQSDFLFSNIHRDLNKLNQICQLLRNKTIQKLKDSYHHIYGSEIYQSLKMQAKVIDRASTKNSTRRKIVQLYGQLIYLLSKPLKRGIEQKMQHQMQKRNIPEQQINKREGDNNIQSSCLSIKNIIANPYQIRQVDSEQLVMEIHEIATLIRQVCSNIWSLLVNMSSINSLEQRLGSQQSQPKILKQSPFHVANWHLFKEKLFTTDSFYAYWDNLFQYSIFTIQVQPSIFIQCAIIHRDKLMKNTRFDCKVAVLFNNPNGAIFQALALSSSYIHFYLKLGFEIVLWNYRGYAKSNGFSSCRHSISDVCKIYKQVTVKFGLKIQVVHGYSIGGISAISLTHQINRSNRGQIKLLIADRTFSSIDRVAKGFISTTNIVFRVIRKASRTIVKFFLYSQCITNSQVFAECDCEKVIIHDLYDQIISDEGSIKKQLLQLALRQHNYFPQNLSLEQLSCSSKFNQFQMQQTVIKYAQSISALHERNRRAYETVSRILFDTDGAGFHINMQEDLEIQNGLINISKQRIKKDSKLYLLGLILYGPKNGVPRLPTFWGEEQWRRKRIEQRIKLLCEYEKKVENTIDQQHIRCIIECLNYAAEQHSQQNNRAKRLKYGYLIVSKVGHNSELKSEYVELENIFKNVYPEVLAKQ